MSTPQEQHQEPLVPDSSDGTQPEAHTSNSLTELQRQATAFRTSQQQDFEALRAEMAAEFAALRAATTPGSPREQPLLAGTTLDDTEQRNLAETSTSRRALLKWGGLAAAAGLAAAGGATLTSQTAHAADGGSLTLGSAINTAEHVTTLTYDGTETAPKVFQVASTADDSLTVYANAGAGVNTAAAGVLSIAGAGAASYGVSGSAGSNARGVEGVAKGADSYGVWGDTDAGFGVVGISGSGIDVAAAGSGRIWQFPVFAVGAPTSGTYNAGEQFRDANGDLYICVTSGTPGGWKRVAALDTHYTGGANVFLPTPIRVYDSRVANAPLVGSMTRNVQVTGVVINGVQVPKGATGCIGNLTVVRPTASGYLVIYPQGSATPSTSTVNFVANQTVPNAFAVGLSAGGQVTVHSFTSGQCHFIVDINGFVV